MKLTHTHTNTHTNTHAHTHTHTHTNTHTHTHSLSLLHTHIPQFYGIPKIHKKFTRVPPVRPIVSQCNSTLYPTDRFIDHILQPIAQSYPDYLHNYTSLSILLQNLTVPDNALLVTLDISNLYSSIPQTDMLQTIYQEMVHNRHLLPFEPNMIIRLLHTNINHNYFQFASLIFQQIKGTAMGAAYSPTVANTHNIVLKIYTVSEDIHTTNIPSSSEILKLVGSSECSESPYM